MPRIEVEEAEGNVVFKSPNEVFENRRIDFNLKHLVAFGTQVTCFIPPENRAGRKTPGQAKSFDGIVLGYVDDMYGYRVWDISERKTREVSFFHSVVHEGFFPFLDKKKWPEPDTELRSSQLSKTLWFRANFKSFLSPKKKKKISWLVIFQAGNES